MAWLAMLGIVMFVPFMIVTSSIVNGFVLRYMWGWFIAPVFHLPLLTVAQAIGLSMVVKFLTAKYTAPTARTKTGKRRIVSFNSPVAVKALRRALGQTSNSLIVTPLSVLVFAWVIHLFVHPS